MTDQHDLTSIWRAALGELEVVLTKPSFITWFRGTFIFDVSDGLVTIGVPHSFALEWLANKYRTHILEVLQKLLPDYHLSEISFKIAQASAVAAPQRTPVIIGKTFPIETPPIETPTALVEEIAAPLKTNYTFENFIVGTHNRLAHAASLAVASEPGKHHNPLFIYGGVGLGKTHLIQAIGNEILKNNPQKRVLYASCEHFANEFIAAIQAKKTDDFKEKYRSVDVLLIDDIQFLSAKGGTQEEFFHTFNALHQTNRQIVLTSDRMPQAIPELEARLSSRFVWGMVTDIKTPDLETRAAILRQKCEERGVTVDPQVTHLLARSFQNNIRELEGALNQLLAYTELEGVAPTKSIVEQLVKDQRPRAKTVLSVQQIFETVASYFQIPTDDLLGHRRNKEFVHPRQLAMYLLRHELGFSFPKIGRELFKDHTTIIHGVEKIERELPKQAQLQQELAYLKDLLYNQSFS